MTMRRTTPRMPARQAKSPLPLILGGGAGLLVLIIIIAVAAGGSSRKKEKSAEKAAPQTSKSTQDRSVEDTGYIMFICSGSSRHEDREEIIKTCTACGNPSTFFWDNAANAFICYKCKKAFDNTQVKCSLCGKVPTKVRTKQR